jgi:Ca-activated chloride channel family protein
MMQFKSPEFLWLLLLIPLFIIGYILILRRRNQYALRYASLSIVKQALGKGPGKRRHIPPAFFLLGLMLMFIAAARPYGTLTLMKQQATVILAIDVSRSMRANDLSPNRLEAAKAAARAFVELQDANVRIGIVSFSGNAALVQAPTNDREAILAAINRLTLQNSTAIGSGILTALDAIFEKPGNLASSAPNEEEILGAPTPTPTPVAPGSHIPSTIILLTDGQNRTGPLPLDAARIARDRGVRVYTIGVGTTQGGTVPPPDRNPGFGGGQGFGGGGFGGGGGFRTVLDEETLKRVAALTDGQYYHASDSESLLAIYQKLDKELIATRKEEEVAVFFTAGAVVCLLIGGVLSMLWFSQLP